MVVRNARRGLACLALSSAVVVGPAVAPSYAAQAGPTEPGGVHVAVLTPMISTMEFGATVGFPLMCNTGAGTLSAPVAQIPGASDVLIPVFTQASPACADLSTQGGGGLRAMNDQLGPLEALNPVITPGFDAMVPVFEQLNSFAPSLQPFSGTITSLGPMVAFFAGPPKS